MVYIHFPDFLTEEESMLNSKYAKLKKKKKQVQALKSQKIEVEKPSILLKRPKDARDAKEVARKLIKSGNINIAKTEKQSDSFKRPNISQERKKVQNIEASSYHPFSSSSTNSEEDRTATKVQDKNEGGEGRISFLYQQIADVEKKASPQQQQQPPPPQQQQQRDNNKKTGFTVYVSGKGIDEDFLKKNFGEFGCIVNVSMEIEKGRGFITFSKTEATDRAISEMNGKTINGINLTVSLARKQPQIEPINDASSGQHWSTLAVSQSQKGNYKDKRVPQVYDLDIFD